MVGSVWYIHLKGTQNFWAHHVNLDSNLPTHWFKTKKK